VVDPLALAVSTPVFEIVAIFVRVLNQLKVFIDAVAGEIVTTKLYIFDAVMLNVTVEAFNETPVTRVLTRTVTFA